MRKLPYQRIMSLNLSGAETAKTTAVKNPFAVRANGKLKEQAQEVELATVKTAKLYFELFWPQ